MPTEDNGPVDAATSLGTQTGTASLARPTLASRQSAIRTRLSVAASVFDSYRLRNGKPTPSVDGLRRRAKKVDLRFSRSRKNDPINNYGGYQVVEASTGIPVGGYRYDLELSAVAEIITDWETE